MQDSVIHLEASVNGIPLTGLEKYRIQCPLFNFTLPENNTLGLSPQTTQAVSDGNWVFLKPLSVGNHTLWMGLSNYIPYYSCRQWHQSLMIKSIFGVD